MPRNLVALALAALVLQGCTFYKAAPLPAHPSFQPATGASRPFDARDGLDITEIATLAVLNNPDLRAARVAAKVTQAQVFSAGLLPDPQFNLTRDFPTGSNTAGLTSDFVAALGYSFSALLTHSTQNEAARSDMKQAELNLEWQEWQVIAQSRLLFVRLQSAGQRKDLLLRTRAVLADRYERTRAALDAGLVTLDSVTPHLTAVQDVDRQLSDLERQTSQARFEMIALLGLAPDTPLELQGRLAPPEIDASTLQERLPALLAARPDLQALRAGYDAQDARYRVALLGQFPALNLGVQRSRDTSNAYTRGFAIGLTLPIFNGNRGEIRVQDATREKLRGEYQQRLNTSSVDVQRTLAALQISLRQSDDIEAALVPLRAARERMRQALAAHNADALALATLELATLSKEGERLDALQAIQEQRLALLTLTGATATATANPPQRTLN
jgi:outer membrane protein TolC